MRKVIFESEMTWPSSSWAAFISAVASLRPMELMYSAAVICTPSTMTVGVPPVAKCCGAFFGTAGEASGVRRATGAGAGETGGMFAASVATLGAGAADTGIWTCAGGGADTGICTGICTGCCCIATRAGATGAAGSGAGAGAGAGGSAVGCGGTIATDCCCAIT